MKTKSKVIKKGYINIYSDLKPKELRQLKYKLLYKKLTPDWEETLVFLAKSFKDLVRKDSTVLDAGCGNGNYIIDENRKRIKKAIGIDLSPEFTSKNICLDKIFFGDLRSLPFTDESFDAVVSLWVLEHIQTPEKVFSEIYRVLKRKGYFFFATPYKYYLPLFLLQSFLNFKSLKNFLNKKIFDREPEDVFETFYKANTLKKIQDLSSGLFEIKTLQLNPDPSYTSFNDLSFKISSFISRVSIHLGPDIFSPHIIGILQKK